MSEITSCYENLGAQYGEDLGSIKNKFMKLALLHHPDKGGEKSFFDLICKSYKTIRKIRKDERMPTDDKDYKVEEDFQNSNNISQQDFKTFIKKLEAKLTPGYNDFGNIEGNKKFPTEPINYNPNDIDISYTVPKLQTPNNIEIERNNISSDVNYEGRTTDSSKYFGIVEYGKFDTTTMGKDSLGGYDLGLAHADNKVIFDTETEQEFSDVNDKMEHMKDLRDKQDCEINDQIEEISKEKMNSYFNQNSDKYLLECNEDFKRNSEKHKLMLGSYSTA